jgi:hypothetical protein
MISAFGVEHGEIAKGRSKVIRYAGKFHSYEHNARQAIDASKTAASNGNGRHWTAISSNKHEFDASVRRPKNKLLKEKTTYTSGEFTRHAKGGGQGSITRTTAGGGLTRGAKIAGAGTAAGLGAGAAGGGYALKRKKSRENSF